MRRILLSIGALGLITGAADAAVFPLDISPAGGALNLGSTTYVQDHAVGLDPANETAQPVSSATGNEVGTGITYDDVTNTLSFDFAYGAAFGFVDLGASFTDVHFHSPGSVNFPAVNTSAGVIHPLGAFHVPSGARSGRVTGSVVLSALEETDLFDNEIYINIHSVELPAGEIRGQLIPVPEPSSLVYLGLVAGALTTFVSWKKYRPRCNLNMIRA